jgi:hypothetical protein
VLTEKGMVFIPLQAAGLSNGLKEDSSHGHEKETTKKKDSDKKESSTEEESPGEEKKRDQIHWQGH